MLYIHSTCHLSKATKNEKCKTIFWLLQKEFAKSISRIFSPVLQNFQFLRPYFREKKSVLKDLHFGVPHWTFLPQPGPSSYSIHDVDIKLSTPCNSLSIQTSIGSVMFKCDSFLFTRTQNIGL